MKTVMRLLTEHLTKFRITHVFGVPGKAISPLVIETDKSGIKYVLCRHEGGAGFAAAGFALRNNSIGVAIGTSGPGGTNMLTAAAQAKAFNLPVLFITGHPSEKQSGQSLVQDSSAFGTDLVKIFESVTSFSARVERGDLFPLYFKHALEKAWYGKKGPVHLSIPFDVLTEEIDPFEIDLPIIKPTISLNINEIIPLLDNAKSPVMLLGKGVHISKAYEEVKKISERWGIPVMTTPSGKGSFATTSSLSLGGLGVAGSKESYDKLKNGVDLMLVMGTTVSDMVLAGVSPDMFPQQVIHFDIDMTFIGKSISVPTIPILGDLKYNLQQLLNEAGKKTAQAMQGFRRDDSKTVTKVSDPISAVQTMHALRKNLPSDTIMISDSGSHSFYAIKHLEIYEPGTFYFDDLFGAMGHAIGFAIGAKLAQPERKVVCITGDGCLMMHGTEISTAVCNNVSVIFVVMNNGRLDMVEKAMKYGMECVVGAIYETPLNVSQFACSLGATAFCCCNEADIENAIKFGLEHGGPTVVEIMTNPNEIPPTLSRENLISQGDL